MQLFSRRKPYPPPDTSSVGALRKRPNPEIPVTDPLSFVVDLDDLGVLKAYKALETHRGAQCPVFANFGSEYVNPWSGAREQAKWIL